MRVVLDTNILARALPGRNNDAERALLKLAASPHLLITSPFILEELVRVLRYDRQRQIHRLADAKIDGYVDRIAQTALIVSVPVIGNTIVRSDPGADPIVATAVLGRGRRALHLGSSSVPGDGAPRPQSVRRARHARGSIVG